MRDRPLVLWDGDCAFCRRAIDWVRRHDRCQAFEYAPYQETPSPPMTPALEEACARAVHVVHPDGSLLRAGRAALFVLSELGWRRSSRFLSWPPMVWAVELGYAVIARHRRWFSPRRE